MTDQQRLEPATPYPTGRAAAAPRTSGRTKWIIVGGTLGAVAVAGIAFQFARPATSDAAERQAKAAPAAEAETGRSDRYLARVTMGGSSALISWDEVAHECMLRYAQEVLDNMINRKIIEQACKSQGIQIAESEVDQEILEISKKFNMDVDSWYKMLQTDRNITPAQYRRDIIWPMLALRKLAGAQVKITKSEFDKAFERDYGKRCKARVIVMDNVRRANEVWEKAQANPDDFGKLAREYSSDAGSRALDGAVPPIRRFTGNPGSDTVEEAAFKLQKGEISPLIQVGESQYVIILCEGFTDPVVVDKKDVQEELVGRLTEEKTQKLVADVFTRIKKDARVDNYLTSQTTNGAAGQKAPGTIKQTGATAARPPRPATARAPGAAELK